MSEADKETAAIFQAAFGKPMPESTGPHKQGTVWAAHEATHNLPCLETLDQRVAVARAIATAVNYTLSGFIEVRDVD